jgi:two-component system, NtrC family, sensor kinase
MEPIRVLLVDDEENFRAPLAKRLKRREFNVFKAADGPQALAFLAENSVDVVVLDVKMPGQDGLNVLAEIKKGFTDLEVILLTGHATTDDGVNGIKLGAFDYLSKPVEIVHLVGKIRQAHERQKRQAERRQEAVFREHVKKQMVAAERLVSLGTLASGVAHEINNPLAIIGESAGWMRMMLAKPELAQMPRKSDFVKAVDTIDNSLKRAKTITHQMLGFVRKQDQTPVETDLTDLIHGTTTLVKNEVQSKSLEVKMPPTKTAVVIWSIPYQIRQVLLNLLTNAIHASESGGEIDVSVEATNGQVVLAVADNGAGIGVKDLRRIFEPFFSTKPADQGTGLGLYVSRNIVEKLGGKIEVTSSPGKGACFRVTLPKYPLDVEKRFVQTGKPANSDSDRTMGDGPNQDGNIFQDVLNQIKQDTGNDL